MSNAELENSSLELYETAYKLHYIEGNIPEACRIYKVIIDEFPNSNECGYAVIQLQKIQANEVSTKIKSGGFPPVLAIFLIAAIVVCLILSLITLASFKKVHSEIAAITLVTQALSIMYGGSDNDALELLGKAKTLSQGKLSVPYLLAANIYMNSQQYARAKAEFEKFQKASGETDSIFQKMVSVKVEHTEKPVAPQKIDTAPPVAAQSAPAPENTATFKPVVSERAATQTVRPKPRMEKPRPVRPVRKGSAGNPDSVSFF